MTRHRAFALALALFAPAARAQERDVAAALGFDDECDAGEGSDCSMHALQLRGLRKSAIQVDLASMTVHAKARLRLRGLSEDLAIDSKADDACRAFVASLGRCIPGDDMGSRMTVSGVKTMCSCKDKYAGIATACPSRKQDVDDLLSLLPEFCNDCGMAMTEILFGHSYKCQKDDDLSNTTACTADCHDAYCQAAKVCPTEEGVKALLAPCPCPAAALLEVETAFTEQSARHKATRSFGGLASDLALRGCEEVGAAIRESGLPIFSDPMAVTVADVAKTCSLKDKLVKVAPTCAEMKEDIDLVVQGVNNLCSTCGLAAAGVNFNHDCLVHFYFVSPELACKAKCHESYCKVLTDCPAGTVIGGSMEEYLSYSARDINEFRGNITEATKACPC